MPDQLRRVAKRGASTLRAVWGHGQKSAAGFELNARGIPADPFVCFNQQLRALLDELGYFDASWYLQQNRDVAGSGLEPLAHYLEHGWREKRDPHPLFVSAWYLETYDDVRRARLNPLLHFIEHGELEDRFPNPLFAPDWYRERVMRGAQDLRPLQHFLRHGAARNAPTHPAFFPVYYAHALGEALAPGETPLAHYVRAERPTVSPHPCFDQRWYDERLPSVGRKDHRGLLDHLARPLHEQSAACATRQAIQSDTRARWLGVALPRPAQPVHLALGVVTYNNSEKQLHQLKHSIDAALGHSSWPVTAKVYVLHNGQHRVDAWPGAAGETVANDRNLGFGAGHNALMARAFESPETQAYLAINPDGVLHPDALGHLLRMAAATRHTALLEAAQFPEEHPKAYDFVEFDTPWASGACLLVPRAIYEVIGGFDDNFFMYCEDVDYSWRARNAGFSVKFCPPALFYHSTTDRTPSRDEQLRFLRSGLHLARKWGGKEFAARMVGELAALGAEVPASDAGPSAYEVLPDDVVGAADFAQNFTFAKARWS